MAMIPESMGFDDMPAEGRLIRGVRRRGSKPYAVIPGEVREKYDTDRDWDYTMAREGEKPKKFRVADVNLVERRTKQKYVRPDMDPNSIDMPTQTVKLVGPNTIAPATDNPDFDEVNEGVVVPSAEDIMARNNVEIYSDDEAFSTETSDKLMLPMVRRRDGSQPFPADSDMEMPDGLVYRQNSGLRPGWDERQEVHEEYAEEGDEAASMSEMHMGTLRVSDDATLDQLDIIASVAASVLSAGATGYGIYSKIQQDKREKKAIAEQSKQNAIQSAAMFNQQFGQQYSQSLAPQQMVPGQTVMTPQGPMTVAPFAGTGVDWGKVALYGGGALVLVGLAWILVRK
jgi:hypothetical protein